MTTVASTVHGKIDLFGHEGQAKMYHDFRPRYTKAVVDSVLHRISASNRDAYLDIACGSGQLTELISPFFKQSTGIDQSFAQLSEVPSKDNISYIPGSAFELPMESRSMDLVTVAQALHWLVPYSDFFKEVLRVLKPGGSFVTVAYAFPQLCNPVGNEIIKKFYFDILGAHMKPGDEGCWWETNRPTIDGFYQDIEFPAPPTLTKLNHTESMSIAHYMNYLRTLSAYRTYIRSGNPDPLPTINSDLMDAIGAASENDMIDVDIPFFTVSFAV